MSRILPQENLDSRQLCTVGIESCIRLRADAMTHIDGAIAADESNVLPLLVKAWMLRSARDERFSQSIGSLVLESEQRLADAPSSQSDSSVPSLLLALKLSLAGQVVESAQVLSGILEKAPTDLFVHQIVQEEVFWLGRFDWMREITEKAALAWKETSDGYGAFLSFRSFANEEAGYLDEAEEFGRMAIEIDPSDIWAAHSVGHVLLMKGQIRSGIDWLENLSANWGLGNQMRHHLWWHLCLFLLETGEHERILSLLTTEIRNPDSALVRESPAATIDITNVASMLLRLELHGVNVGSHWEALGSICANRVSSHGSAFNNMHDMMVLSATGQDDKANELLESMRNRYQSESTEVAVSYNAVGIPVCEAIFAHRKKDYEGALNRLSGVRHDFALMGASHAQRDVLYQLMVDAANKQGRSDLRTEFLKDVGRIGFTDVTSRAAYKNPGPHINR